MADDPIKSALRLLHYGFYGITSRNDDEVNAMVANWVFQVSFTPRKIALALAKNAHSHRLIREGGVFGVNIFAQADSDALMPFTKGRAKKPDKMAEAQYSDGPETGVPILDGAAAYLEVRVDQFIDIGGDHDLVVGEVVGGGVNKDLDSTEVLNLPELGWSYAG